MSTPTVPTPSVATPTVPTPTVPTPTVPTPTVPTPTVATPTVPTPSVPNTTVVTTTFPTATPTVPTPTVPTPTVPTPTVPTPTVPTPTPTPKDTEPSPTPTVPTPTVPTPTVPTPTVPTTTVPTPSTSTLTIPSSSVPETSKDPYLCKNGRLDPGEWCDPSVPEGCYDANNCTTIPSGGLSRRAFDNFTKPWMCNKMCECDMMCPGAMDRVNFCAWVDECGVICGDGTSCEPTDCEGKDCIEGAPIDIVDITGCEIEHVDYDIMRFRAFGTLYGEKSAVIVSFDEYAQGDVCGENIDSCANRLPLSDEMGVNLAMCKNAPQQRDTNGWDRVESLIKNGTVQLVNYTNEFSLTSLLDCRRPNDPMVNLVGLERIHETRSLYYGAMRTSLVTYQNAKNETLDDELLLSEDVCKFRFTVNGEGVEVICFSVDDVDFKVIWENNVWEEKNCSVKINIRTFIDSAHTRLGRETPPASTGEVQVSEEPMSTDPTITGLEARTTPPYLVLLHPNITALTPNAPEFMFVDTDVECESSDHGCAQSWMLMPVDNFNDTVVIWGQYLVEFWVRGLGYGDDSSLVKVKSIITIDLEHECIIDYKEIDLEAECKLSYDIDFEKSIAPGDGKSHSFLDCQNIYALCELKLHDTLDDYRIWIEDLQVCDKKSDDYIEFDPENPQITGCNSPGLKLGNNTFWVLYNGENFPVFFDGRFLLANESTALQHPSQAGVCWRVRAFSEEYSEVAVQISWKAITNRPDQEILNTHIQPQFTQHHQQRRGVIQARAINDEQVYRHTEEGPTYDVHCNATSQYYDQNMRRCIFRAGYEPDWMVGQNNNDDWTEESSDYQAPAAYPPPPPARSYAAPPAAHEEVSALAYSTNPSQPNRVNHYASSTPSRGYETSRSHYEYTAPETKYRPHDKDHDDDDDGLSTAAIVGIVIGVLAALCILGGIFYCECRAPQNEPVRGVASDPEYAAFATPAGAAYPQAPNQRRRRIGEDPMNF